VDLAEIEFDAAPLNPYGKHLRSINVEVFTRGQLVTVLDESGCPVVENFILNGEDLNGKKEKGTRS